MHTYMIDMFGIEHDPYGFSEVCEYNAETKSLHITFTTDTDFDINEYIESLIDSEKTTADRVQVRIIKRS